MALVLACSSCLAVSLVLGLAAAFALNLLAGASLFLFSVALVSFLMWGLVSGGGSKLVIQ